MSAAPDIRPTCQTVLPDTALTWVCDLYRLSQAIAYQADSGQVQQSILAHVVDRFDAATGCLALCDASQRSFTIVAGIGVPDHVIGTVMPFGTGVLGWVAEQGEPLLLNGDISDDPRFAAHARSRQTRRPVSAMCWPLMMDERIVGVLSLNRHHDAPPFTEQDMERVEISVGLITLVVENARLHRSQQLRMRRLTDANARMTLLNDALSLCQRNDLDNGRGELDVHALEDLASSVAALCGAEFGAVVQFYPDSGLRSFYLAGNDVKASPLPVPDGRAEGVLAHVFTDKARLRAGNVPGEGVACALPGLPSRVVSLLIVPVLVGGRCWGALCAVNATRPQAFAEHDELNLGVFAGSVAMLVERLRIQRGHIKAQYALEQEREEQRRLITRLQEAQSQLLQSEKLAAIGQLAAGVAHEINNPVGYINSNLRMLSGYIERMYSVLDACERLAADPSLNPETRQQMRAVKAHADFASLRTDIVDLVRESQEGVKRVCQIVQDLKDFAHVDGIDWQMADLHQGLDSTLNVASNEIKYKAEVVKEYGDIPLVECIGSQINQVFMNILLNAAQAIGERGTITLRTGSLANRVWVEISDTGAGIAPEHVTRIFDPFFTTKPVGKGTGLGLSLSYNIIRQHGGSIEVDSVPGNGTTFRVWLPVKQPHTGQD